MEQLPLVSIICLCYNHEKFVAEALDSVLNQNYPNLEIIVADDFSTDNSRRIIEEYAAKFPQIRFLPNSKNLGNCATFNNAFKISTGEYIIDFATDDVMLPGRILEQVKALEKAGPDYGIVFTDAELIDEAGKQTGYLYPRKPDGTLVKNIPSGFIFADLLRSHFISAATTMIRRSVLEKLGGYDVTLLYEDFDLWVRSAPFYKFYFLDKVLTKRRLHPHQLSRKQYAPNDKQIFSTIEVIRKVQKLVKSEEEKSALIHRIKLEFKQAILTENKTASKLLYTLLREEIEPEFFYKLLFQIGKLNLPFRSFRKLYYQLKYNREG